MSMFKNKMPGLFLLCLLYFASCLLSMARNNSLRFTINFRGVTWRQLADVGHIGYPVYFFFFKSFVYRYFFLFLLTSQRVSLSAYSLF